MLKERFSADLKPQPLFEPQSNFNTFQRTKENFRGFDQRRPENFKSFDQRKPEIFRSVDQRRPENSFLGQETIRPGNIFSRNSPLVTSNPLPQTLPPSQPPPFNNGPFANTKPEIEEELESFRAEAEKANEFAIKKQIEALKKIIASQNE